MGFSYFLAKCLKPALVLAGLLAASSLLGHSACGQAAAATDVPAAAVARAAQAYRTATQAESHLLNGLEYVNLTPAYFTGSPFFASTLPQRGTIEYDGRYYARVPLRYEQVRDQVILFDSVRNVHLQLFSEKITDFSFGGHHFVRLEAAMDKSYPAGFYEVLVDGPTRLLTTRIKKALKYTDGRNLKGEFVPEERFVVQHQGRYSEVAKLSQVLEILPDQKPALQRLARSSKLRFDDTRREAALVALLRYYNELAQ